MSSRAIPTAKLVREVLEKPFVFQHWGKNQKGMQAHEPLPPDVVEQCIAEWLIARDAMVKCATNLSRLGVHKQNANRALEPFQWMRTILSTTSIEHFRKLRVSRDAEPHFRDLARWMVNEFDRAEPRLLLKGEWHLPLVGFPGDEVLSLKERIKLSSARCGRVSYLTHDGVRDPSKDHELHDNLLGDEHWSPFEHPSTPLNKPRKQSGNYRGWKQYRKFFKNEFTPEKIA